MGLPDCAASGRTLEWKSDHEHVSHTGGFDVAFAILPERLTLTTGIFVHSGNGQTHTSG